MTDIAELEADNTARIDASADLAALEEARVAMLGKSGNVTLLARTLGGLSLEDRKTLGPQINQMRDRLATKLAEPALYDQARVGELETWQKKYAEVMEGLDRAEAMWLKAEARLESAGV